MARVIWIISEGSPGHVSQSVGLANALAACIPIHIERLECRSRLNGAARAVVRLWMGRSGRGLPDWILHRWLRLETPADAAATPDLILASGGKSVFAARTLAARHEVPFVFLGERKPYPSEWFHTVFTPSAFETSANDLPIELIPTQVTAARVNEAAAAWVEKPPGRLWAAIIGGASVSHRYNREDWHSLGLALTALAEKEGVRWLLTTSRRTTAAAEQILRASIGSHTLARAIWWSECPEKRMAAFLGAAEVVVVTQDSVTMVTEAVASGRPVVVARPANVSFPANSFLPGYFDRLENQGYILRSAIRQLHVVDNERLAELTPLIRPIEQSMAKTLISRLGWS